MAHFAKLGINSKVIGVEVVADADCQNADNNEDETVGIQFLENIHGWPLWKKTSYNTSSGKHYTEDGLGQKVESADQSKAFRKNYAGIGFTYDASRDAFIPPKPYPSWTLVEDTCQWTAPSAMPDDGKMYTWNEDTTSWKEKT